LIHLAPSQSTCIINWQVTHAPSLRLSQPLGLGIHRINYREIGRVIGKQVDLHNTRLDSYKAEVNLSVENQIKLGQEDFYYCLDSFKSAFISASRGLGRRLDNVELKLIGAVENTSN
jgi:hypothetical protein